jgi:hypothetical protein
MRSAGRPVICSVWRRSLIGLGQAIGGLIWLLRGRPVLALTEGTAAIESPTGTTTVYRRHNKPALGPLGDSLDDFR